MVQPPFQEVLQAADQTVSILALCQGTTASRAPFYAYMLVPPSRYEAFVEASKKGGFKLAEFGEIILTGSRPEPHEAVRRKIEQEYRANPNFTELARKALREFADALEKPQADNA